ncbi:GFA family protein [Novosphingobium sp. G106]|uniref:GFA family protein n=1 Tax=Novosphingobium sp. G106 TaxID=2849500 RepID=UPI001C2D4754|nr:GFA family protein [Novosphingobium sp. G106]MBV1687496.1 GFA family protein [Novosphingobium sp. G106]
MTRTTRGSCLCGTATFRVIGDFEAFYLCHCGRCRKDTGSAHGANLFSSSATIEWLSGEDCVRTYHLPETRHSKSFCGECGSALPRVEGGSLVVPAGSLDDRIAIRPDAHIFVASRAEWDDKLEDVPKRNAFSE